MSPVGARPRGAGRLSVFGKARAVTGQCGDADVRPQGRETQCRTRPCGWGLDHPQDRMSARHIAPTICRPVRSLARCPVPGTSDVVFVASVCEVRYLIYRIFSRVRRQFSRDRLPGCGGVSGEDEQQESQQKSQRHGCAAGCLSRETAGGPQGCARRGSTVRQSRRGGVSSARQSRKSQCASTKSARPRV